MFRCVYRAIVPELQDTLKKEKEIMPLKKITEGHNNNQEIHFCSISDFQSIS